jgi:hypothetical protein
MTTPQDADGPRGAAAVGAAGYGLRQRGAS